MSKEWNKERTEVAGELARNCSYHASIAARNVNIPKAISYNESAAREYRAVAKEASRLGETEHSRRYESLAKEHEKATELLRNDAKGLIAVISKNIGRWQ